MADRTLRVKSCGWCRLVRASPTPGAGADVAVRRSYKFRLRPTKKQEAALIACLEDTRQLSDGLLPSAAAAFPAGQVPLGRREPPGGGREVARVGDVRTVASVARLHGKVRRQRLDHAHTTALAPVRAHDVIVHEDLKITNMTRRPKPRPDGRGSYEPNGAAAKSGLNKSINDAGWGIFLRILSVKAESAGRTAIAVNPRHTSQRCAQCGHTAAGNRVTQAEFRCLACGHQAHADINAARNILRAGLALQEA